ncbi:MAG: response regulator [Bdellovibrionales bacterium]|nr:response regulator [Bdellovibrionales bacterium]
MATLNKIRVLVADDDRQLARRLSDFLIEKGLDVKTVHNGKEALTVIADWHPRFVLADLMLSEGNAFEILEHLKRGHSGRNTSFTELIVMSGHNVRTNVARSLELGATDYVVKPFRYEDILQRLVFHCRKHRIVKDLSNYKGSDLDEGTLLLHLTDLILRAANASDPIPDIMFNLTRMVALKLGGVRCSVVQVLDHENGMVVMSHDDRKASGIRLDLNKYPEIVHVYNTRLMVAIENLETSAELKAIKRHVQSIMFNSIVVCPISRSQKMFGVLSLRLPAEKEHLSDNEIRFVEIVSHALSLVLSTQNSYQIGEFWKPAA